MVGIGNKKDLIRNNIKQFQANTIALSFLAELLVYAWFIALYMSLNYTQFPSSSNNLYTGGFKNILQKSNSLRKYRVLKHME